MSHGNDFQETGKQSVRLLINFLPLRTVISNLLFYSQLTFAEISQETRLPIGEVELLVMKALAQGLVRGAIDQVAGTVNMTWVQPRVLDRTQITGMVQQLDRWCKDVNTMETLLESRATEILTL